MLVVGKAGGRGGGCCHRGRLTAGPPRGLWLPLPTPLELVVSITPGDPRGP